MKKIIVFAVLIVGCMSAKAQFPTTDSLRAFINRYIRNSAVEAFQNLRLNTALIGMTNYLDSAYGGQVVSFTAANDSTARLITLGGDTFDVVIRGNPPSIALNNIGSGYNLVATPTGNIKRLNNSYGILIDSTTTANTITIRADTSSTNHLVTQSDLNDAISGGAVDTSALKNQFVPLHFPSAKTVRQYGYNLVFTGGGKVRSDSLSLTKTFTPFMSGDSAVFGGMSIVYGSSATAPDSTFPARVARSHSLFLRNLGVPSAQIWGAVKIQMGWINSGHNAYEGYMPSLNDVRNTNILSGANRKTINSIINGMKAMWMNHMAKTAIGANDGSLTRSGSWSGPWDASVEAGKKTNAAYTSSAGAYVEYTFTDSTVGVQFMGNNTGGAGTVTIAIDGSTVETFSLNSQHDGNVGSYMPTAKFYTGLTNASHTIRVTNTSGGGLMIVDYFTNLRDAATAPPVCFFHEPYLDATGYSGGQASDAAIDTINVKYDSLRNSLPVAYKARTIVARTNTRYVANTSSGLSGDHVHPNDLGHRQIALAESDAVNSVIGADSGTIQYGYDGNLYVDAKRIAYQNSVTLQDAINNGPTLNAPADIRGSIFEFNGFTRIGLNFLKIGSTSQGALAHGTLGVQGPLGGVFIGNRTGDTTTSSGWIYYAENSKLNLYDVANARSVIKTDTSMRTLFVNNAVDNVLSSATATVHIPGNRPGRAGHASLKIDTCTLMATPEAYAIEATADSLYWTNGAGTRVGLNRGGGGNGIYGGSGSLPSNVTVTGGNNSITWSDIFAFNILSDYNTIAKANGSGIYSEAVVGAGNIYEIGYTPTAGIFSKGAGLFIDTNNNVGLGTQPPTTMPLYATGATTYIQGLQSNQGNFYRVSSFTADFTAGLNYYFISIDATSGNVTMTLPAASTAFGNTMGIVYKIQRVDNSGNTVTVQRAGSDTINGTTSFTLTSQYQVKQMQCTSTSTWAQW